MQGKSAVGACRYKVKNHYGLASVTTYRVGQVAELLGVEPTRCGAGPTTGASDRDAKGGERLIDGAELARFLTETAPPGDEPPVLESARNRFPGIVTQVEKDGLVAVVHIQAGPHRVTSLMTREAADELGIEPGDLAVGGREVDERGRGSPTARVTTGADR